MPRDYDRFDVILLVTDDRQEMHHRFIKEFNSALLADSITTPHAREYRTLIILLKGPSEAFRQAFRDKINLDQLKTTAHGAIQTPGPNPLDKGGSMH
jgi:hypothetical protein